MGKTGLWRRRLARVLIILLSAVGSLAAVAQEAHRDHATEQLGKVSFAVSCEAGVREQFNRGVALLHSFAYTAAKDAFQEVAKQDPQCAMALWGIAMSYFHQLWEPPLATADISSGQKEIELAQQIGTNSERESGFIEALSVIYKDAGAVPYSVRASNYERAMRDVALANPKDVEAQVFYALALLANASPTDKSHARQKQAADILEPLDRPFPQHPGIPHYLIHAYDNAEMANRGLPAARAYSQIAPAAPHALHMPSHIYTRLGLWDESIAANTAARKAAHQQGDAGEELHAMDYLVYAYLQTGRDNEAAQIIRDLKKMPVLAMSDFKVAYASTAMPIRYAVERQQWEAAGGSIAASGAPPQVVAIAVWARGMGMARGGQASIARREAAQLRQIEGKLRESGNGYWATQTTILRREVEVWCAQADHQFEEAAALMRKVADDEDAIEKLPVTPGAIIPAREQLGELLLEQKQPALAMKEFEATLANTPGRRGALQGATLAAQLSGPR